MNIQGWFPLGLTDLISLQSKGLSRLSRTTVLKASILWCSAFFMVLFSHLWASLVAQLVKNLPAMQKTWVQSLVGKIPWRRESLPTPVFWPREFHGLYSPWGHKESDTTEQLSHTHTHTFTYVHDYWKNLALTTWIFVRKVMSLFFTTLSRFVIAFFPRSIF